MKVSLAYLQEFLKIPLSYEELAEVMTLAGLEVEGIDKQGDDVVFQLSLTPNLGHCMSIVGVARELAALLNLPMKMPKWKLTEEGKEISQLLDVTVKSKKCLRYCSRVIEGVKVGPSPDWLREKLASCGVQSINNVVDVTNYVMMGWGQPMHAFDLDQLEGGRLLVLEKTDASSLMLLDEKEHALPKEGLFLCDAKGPVAIAGVMGGLKSSVSVGTTRVVLESACFDPSVVRKMSKALALRTDSAIRFEKGIDPMGVKEAVDQAAAILQKVAGGRLAKGCIDIAGKTFTPLELTCRTKRVNHILGTQLSVGEILSIFERLQFTVLKEEEGVMTLLVPTYRNDIHEEIDLIEEIARMYGLNNIPMRPETYSGSTIPDHPIYLMEKKTRRLLLQEGLQEWMSCDLINPQIAKLTHANEKDLIAVLKPASVDQSILRPSLLPSMLLCVKYNMDHQNYDISIFEIGRIHYRGKDGVVEHSCAAILMSGKRAPYHHDPKPQAVDFFDLKGALENLLEGFFVIRPSFQRGHSPHFHPKQQAHILVDGTQVGICGQLHPKLVKQVDIDQEIFFAQIDLHVLHKSHCSEVLFNGLPLYPSSERDWTLTVRENVETSDIIAAIQQVDAPFLEKITVLDLYKSEQIGKDKKNVTLRFIYRDPNQTIAIETIEKEHEKITESVAKQFTI